MDLIDTSQACVLGHISISYDPWTQSWDQIKFIDKWGYWGHISQYDEHIQFWD